MGEGEGGGQRGEKGGFCSVMICREEGCGIELFHQIGGCFVFDYLSNLVHRPNCQQRGCHHVSEWAA